MKRRYLLLLLCAGAAAVGFFVTRPQTVDGAAVAALTADPDRGEMLFYAMGCASCHAAPDSDDRLVLAGGYALASDFGTFYAPNISSDPEHGIGGWSDTDLANAVLKGTSPSGQHYFPAFPYTSYGRASLQDAVDLAAFLRTLPADPTPSRPHDVGFPFNMRWTLGGWKMLFATTDWVVTDVPTPELEHGRTLVEAWGHCAECHTPRNALGGLDRANWLAGAPNPSGDGRIPSLRPSDLNWSAGDIAAYLQSGFTPEFDVVGGSMASVVKNTAELSDSDRAAIAAYLVALPSD